MAARQPKGALLLEHVLLVTLVPLSFINMTLFLTAVPIAIFVFGYLASWWILRKVPSAPMFHGALPDPFTLTREGTFEALTAKLKTC